MLTVRLHEKLRLAWHAFAKDKKLDKQFSASAFRMECFVAIFGHCRAAAIPKHQMNAVLRWVVRRSVCVCNYKLIIRQSHVFRVICEWLKIACSELYLLKWGIAQLEKHVQSHINCLSSNGIYPVMTMIWNFHFGSESLKDLNLEFEAIALPTLAALAAANPNGSAVNVLLSLHSVTPAEQIFVGKTQLQEA